tara:strand:+ start:2895 stop:3122 length:228 start_codon:yes stop_codon:yes gene_type:complete
VAKKKKITEEKLVEGILDWMWRSSMKGKKGSIIQQLDHDPGVAKALDKLEKAGADAKDAIRNSTYYKKNKHKFDF